MFRHYDDHKFKKIIDEFILSTSDKTGTDLSARADIFDRYSGTLI